MVCAGWRAHSTERVTKPKPEYSLFLSSVAHYRAGQSGLRRLYRSERGKLAIIQSRQKLEDFGCFTPEGIKELRRGASPTITKGPHTGEGIALDHVLPRAAVPELAARFYNFGGHPDPCESGEVRENRAARTRPCPTLDERRIAFSSGLEGG